MKTEKFNFLWFEEEDRRKILRASVCTDCKLHVGEELRRKLPARIRYGFDKENRTLAIAESQDGGISMPKNGMVNATALCKQFREMGLTLPIVFEFEKDTTTGFYLGYIVPQKQANAERQYDVGQLLVIYQPQIDRIINQIAKTTPKAERKAIATAAFCEAVENYDDGCGDLKTYLEEYLRRSLITENRQYTAEYRDLRLDATSYDDEGKPFTLHHALSGQSFIGITQAENRIMAEQFLNSLSNKERKLVRLMREELKLPQIALELELTQDEVIEMGRTIGKKREEFYTVA
jgi:DNA-directed RNA polymerase specialized sigma subunit